ncbi:hypothetical protein [uncultured Phocaeicola sp.]|nr:hypothetical protein [uncultured Phocaeicola sp.]
MSRKNRIVSVTRRVASISVWAETPARGLFGKRDMRYLCATKHNAK